MLSGKTVGSIAALLLLLAVLLPSPALPGDQHAAAYIQSLYAEEEPLRKARFSPRLDRLWAECYRQESEEGYVCLDFDMFVMGQDAALTDLAITQTSGGADKAVVDAHFKNFGKDHIVKFDLSRDSKGWMIDEMRSGCYILSELLQEQSDC